MITVIITTNDLVFLVTGIKHPQSGLTRTKKEVWLFCHKDALVWCLEGIPERTTFTFVRKWNWWMFQRQLVMTGHCHQGQFLHGDKNFETRIHFVFGTKTIKRRCRCTEGEDARQGMCQRAINRPAKLHSCNAQTLPNNVQQGSSTKRS